MAIKKPTITSSKTTTTKKPTTTSTKKTGTTSSSGGTAKNPTSGSTSGSSAVKKPTGGTVGSSGSVKKPLSGGSSSSSKSRSKSSAKSGTTASSKSQSQPTSKQDIGKKQAFDGKGSSDKNIKSFVKSELPPDYDTYPRIKLLSSDMMSLATNCPLAQDVLLALKHETCSELEFMPPEKWLKSFALYGRDPEWDAKALKILALRDTKQSFQTTKNGRGKAVSTIYSKNGTQNAERAKNSEHIRYKPEPGAGRILLPENTPFDCLIVGRDDLCEAWERLASSTSEMDFETMEQLQSAMQIAFEDGSISASELQHITLTMESTFGYNIEWVDTYFSAGDQGDTERANLLLSLLTSNLHVAAYLEELRDLAQEQGISIPSLSGIEMFGQYFAATPSGQVTIFLGANDLTLSEEQAARQAVQEGAFQGRVPLPTETQTDLQSIFIGSQASVATITHEFGHQLDRFFNVELSIPAEIVIQGNSFLNPNDSPMPISIETYLREIALNHVYKPPQTGLLFNRDVLEEMRFTDSARTIRRGASGEANNQEVFADLFMAAVIGGRGFTVDPLADALSDGSVAFRDTQNAQDVEEAIRRYLLNTINIEQLGWAGSIPYSVDE